MKISPQELINTAPLRAGLFSLFSRLFRAEADRNLLESLKNGLKESDFSTALWENIHGSDFVKGFKNLRNFFSNHELNSDLQQELASDYASLFLGAGKNPAHPFESVYTSEERLIMRGPWEDVRRIYHEHGLLKEKRFTQPDDHIAVELDFMAYLCLEMQAAVEKRDEESIDRLRKTQKDFIKKHLASWVPEFCDDILKGSAKYDFYRAVAQILRAFILTEEGIL